MIEVKFSGTLPEILTHMRVFMGNFSGENLPKVRLEAAGVALVKGEPKEADEAPSEDEKHKKEPPKPSQTKKAAPKKKPAPEPEEDEDEEDVDETEDDGGEDEEEETQEGNGSEVEEIDRAFVRGKCKEFIDAYGTEALAALLKKLGYRTFGEVKEDDYVNLLRKVEAEL